jgi:hypothetical protein
MDPIQHLLSSIYDLDAVVQIGVYEGQKPQLELNVGRYALKIIPSTQDTIAISIAQHKPNNDAQELASERCDHIILQAVQLQALEQEPIVLERHYSEGDWQVEADPAARHKGCLVYIPQKLESRSTSAV